MNKDSTIEGERYEELLEAVWQLPRKYQLKLVSNIVKGTSPTYSHDHVLDECMKRMKLYAKVLMSLFSSTAPISESTLLSRSRVQPLPDCRRVIFYQLRKDGFTLSTIKNVSGFHHATILTHCNSMTDALAMPVTNPRLIDMHSTFVHKLHDMGEDGYTYQTRIPKNYED